MIVQIYEIQTPEEAQSMVRLGVDHVGTVIQTPAQCENPLLKDTVTAVQSAGAKSSMIPLFHDLEAIGAALDFYQPDIVHFCETLPVIMPGTLDPTGPLFRQMRIRKDFPGIAVMRSIPIPPPGWAAMGETLNWAALFEPVSDYFLTDTLLPSGDACIEASYDDCQPVSGFVGITGKVCDWDIAAELVQQCRIPVILAGGIGPTNVCAGIGHVKPAGIDSCTLTNAIDANGKSVRFKKDPAKVKALVDAVRRAEQKQFVAPADDHHLDRTARRNGSTTTRETDGLDYRP